MTNDQPICKTYPDGRKEWWLNGKVHRTDGPAVEDADGYKEWRLDGKRHRTDGPAVEWPNGSKAWWLNGKIHRTDGPAVVYDDGRKKEWWLNNEKVTWQQVYHAATTDEARVSILYHALT